MPFFTGTFINWTPDMTNQMLNFMGDLISDFTPLLIPIIAIGVGLIVIGAIVHAIRG